METTGYSETSTLIYEATLSHIPEESNLQKVIIFLKGKIWGETPLMRAEKRNQTREATQESKN
jgi:hypothetical protein